MPISDHKPCGCSAACNELSRLLDEADHALYREQLAVKVFQHEQDNVIALQAQLVAKDRRIADLRTALHSIKESELTCAQDFSQFAERRAIDALSEDNRAAKEGA